MSRTVDPVRRVREATPAHQSSGALVHEFFRRFARATSNAIGSPIAFVVAVLLIVVWLVTGPWFHYSETWQLLINTGTTIVTFLVVFMIQNTQNHDSRAIHLKLDELIRAMKTARNTMVDLEDLPDDALTRLEQEMRAIRTDRRASSASVERRTD
ncbi:MAG: low affinity iron permease family protein [Kofleriaceae bacterium]